MEWKALRNDFCSRFWPGAAILELGSRARSGITYRHLFGGLAYTGLDISPGENVDVVGDAHRLSSLFHQAQFDFAFSVSVFEHLAWPWKAVLELNFVLKPRGLIYTQSHQSWPRHEWPWDFFRFSASAWRSLFCRTTGFRVLGAVDDIPARMRPLHDTSDPTLAIEDQPAFLVSACIAEKVGPPCVSWDATPDDCLADD